MDNASFIELEIHQLLQEEAPEAAGARLLKKFDWKTLKTNEIETLCQFYLTSGLTATLCEHLVNYLDEKFYIPWAYLTEALFSSTSGVPQSVKESLIHAAEKQNSLRDLSRSLKLDSWYPPIKKARTERYRDIKDIFAAKKAELLSQYEIFKSQGLLEKENQLLQRMIKIYPEDQNILNLNKNFQERKIQEFLSRVKGSTRKSQRTIERPTEENLKIFDVIEKSMHDELILHPQEGLQYDFAIAHLMWQNPEASLRLLHDSKSMPANWLRLELMLNVGRFVDLLSIAEKIENEYASDPESSFAVTYYRAQALWGLGQKYSAIEILESLLISSPDYRSSQALLTEWKSELE